MWKRKYTFLIKNCVLMLRIFEILSFLFTGIRLVKGVELMTG